MHSTRKIKEDLIYVGGSDRRLSRFENLFPIPRGVSYNSYVLLDDKTVLMDTADESISRQYIENVVHALDGRPLDYMIVQQMAAGPLRDDRRDHEPLSTRRRCSALHKAAQMLAPVLRPRSVSDRTAFRRWQGRRRSSPPAHIPCASCSCAHGPLAGGHDDLRRNRQDPVLCGRIRHLRCAGRRRYLRTRLDFQHESAWTTRAAITPTSSASTACRCRPC